MANLLPHVNICFPGSDQWKAKLFFRTPMEATRFCEKRGCPMDNLPLSFIYFDKLFWPKGKPFLFNSEVRELVPADICNIEYEEYRNLYREILELAEIINPSRADLDPMKGKETRIFATHVIGISFGDILDLSGGNELEKKIIDQLDLPALENSLNEAVRVENYDAAAYIRDKIKAKDHVIIEFGSRLRITNKL